MRFLRIVFSFKILLSLSPLSHPFSLTLSLPLSLSLPHTLSLSLSPISLLSPPPSLSLSPSHKKRKSKIKESAWRF